MVVIALLAEPVDIARQYVNFLLIQYVTEAGHRAVATVAERMGNVLGSAAVKPDVIGEIRCAQDWIACAICTVTHGTHDRVLLTASGRCGFPMLPLRQCKQVLSDVADTLFAEYGAPCWHDGCATVGDRGFDVVEAGTPKPLAVLKIGKSSAAPAGYPVAG